jgi:hypothetical protein
LDWLRFVAGALSWGMDHVGFVLAESFDLLAFEMEKP